MKKRITALVLALFLAILSVIPIDGANAASSKSFPVTFKDDYSKTAITINTQPKRIVSLYPSNTEIVFALGKGKYVVGVSDYCNYPVKEVEKLPKLGGMTLNTEKILATKPDLILMHTSQIDSNADAIKLFKKAGAQVVAVGDAASFDQAYSDIRILANAVGASVQAEKIIAGMKAKLNAIKKKAAKIKVKKKVFVEVDTYGGYWTTGKNTFMDEMLTTIGAINVANKKSGWVSMSEENVVKLAPQVIIVTYAKYVPNAVQDVLTRKGFAQVPAVKNNAVYTVDDDTVSRPGPRLIDGVEALAKAIYPTIYK